MAAANRLSSSVRPKFGIEDADGGRIEDAGQRREQAGDIQVTSDLRRCRCRTTSASATIVGKGAHLLADTGVAQRQRRRAAMVASPTSMTMNCRLPQMPGPDVDRAGGVEADRAHLAAGEELDGIAQHQRQADGDEKELQRAGARRGASAPRSRLSSEHGQQGGDDHAQRIAAGQKGTPSERDSPW